jgi:hypothetical protein
VVDLLFANCAGTSAVRSGSFVALTKRVKRTHEAFDRTERDLPAFPKNSLGDPLSFSGALLCQLVPETRFTRCHRRLLHFARCIRASISYRFDPAGASISNAEKLDRTDKSILNNYGSAPS